MPYQNLPQNDYSGLHQGVAILAQGAGSFGAGLGNFIGRLRKEKQEAEEQRTTLSQLRGRPGTESEPGSALPWGRPEGPNEGSGEGSASEADQEQYKTAGRAAETVPVQRMLHLSADDIEAPYRLLILRATTNAGC